jgi:hypothetical protein
MSVETENNMRSREDVDCALALLATGVCPTVARLDSFIGPKQ